MTAVEFVHVASVACRVKRKGMVKGATKEFQMMCFFLPEFCQTEIWIPKQNNFWIQQSQIIGGKKYLFKSKQYSGWENKSHRDIQIEEKYHTLIYKKL